jgi:uncharacterized protein (DUF305 family)
MPVSTRAPIIETPDDDDLVLPWWFSWWRVALLAAGATLAIVGAVGLLVKSQQPGDDSVDAAFLRDMRDHHDQAIFMAMTFRDTPGVDPTLRVMASEILIGQSFETGQMVELLRGMNAEEENSSGVAMEWMDMDVATAEMPGMASPDQLTALASAEGAAADKLFVELMNAHHEGGIHMAETASDLAESDRIADLARRMAANQRVEIEELTDTLAKSQGA